MKTKAVLADFYSQVKREKKMQNWKINSRLKHDLLLVIEVKQQLPTLH